MTRVRRQTAVALAAMIVTPLLHGLAFPPARLPLLAWVAFVPWFVAIRLLTAPAAAAVSAVTTLLGTYLVAGWLPRAVSVYYAQPFPLGIALFVGAWTVTLAPWFLAFTAAYQAIARRFAAALPLLVAAAWTAGELGRVRLTGDPFALLGYSQTDVLPLVQIADLTGVYGIGFLLVAANAALAELGLLAIRGHRPPARVLAGLAATAAAVALALGYGGWSLRDSSGRNTPATRVAIAQANLDLGSQWRQDLYGRNLEDYLRLTIQAAQQGAPALVVWPESAMTFFVEDEPLYRASLASVLVSRRLQLLAGGVHTAGADPPRYHNSAFLIAPDGTVLARYDKQRLLPFAEYFPFSSISLLRREFARVREFTPGGPAALLPSVAGAAGIVICNEALFPEIVADRVRAGATFLVNLSNDSWLLDPQFAAHAVDATRLRAVEQRRWLVRASTSGPSAIVDPWGRVQGETAPFTRATLAGTIAPLAQRSVYGRVGDAFGLACGLATVAAAARGSLTRTPRPGGDVTRGSDTVPAQP